MYHKVGDVVHRSDYSIRQLTLAGRVALAAAATIAGLENVPTRAGIVSTVAVEERQDSGSNHHLASAVVGVGGALGLVALGLAYAKKTRALHADKDEDTATPYATTNTDQNTNTNLDPETNTAYVRSCTADNVEVQRNYPPMSMSQKQSQPVFNLN
jgi:hypothetical protein